MLDGDRKYIYTLLTFSLFPFEPRPHRGPVHLHPGPGGSGREAQEAGGGPERQREKGTHLLLSCTRPEITSLLIHRVFKKLVFEHRRTIVLLALFELWSLSHSPL